MLRPLLLALTLIPFTLSGADPAAALSKNDVAFLQHAAVYNLTEVRAAEIALARSLTPDERVYIEALKREHAQANDELATLARQKGITLGTSLPSDQQEELTRIERYTDEAFNETFLEDRIACHQRAVRHLERVREDSADADIRRYAEHGLIAVHEHLETAKRLEARY